MFQRLQLEAWLHQCPRIATMIFMGVFVLTLVRALTIPKKRLHHMEELPLIDEEIPRNEN